MASYTSTLGFAAAGQGLQNIGRTLLDLLTRRQREAERAQERADLLAHRNALLDLQRQQRDDRLLREAEERAQQGEVLPRFAEVPDPGVTPPDLTFQTGGVGMARGSTGASPFAIGASPGERADAGRAALFGGGTTAAPRTATAGGGTIGQQIREMMGATTMPRRPDLVLTEHRTVADAQRMKEEAEQAERERQRAALRSAVTGVVEPGREELATMVPSLIPSLRPEKPPTIRVGGREFPDTPDGRRAALEWERRISEAGRGPTTERPDPIEREATEADIEAAALRLIREAGGDPEKALATLDRRAAERGPEAMSDPFVRLVRGRIAAMGMARERAVLTRAASPFDAFIAQWQLDQQDQN